MRQRQQLGDEDGAVAPAREQPLAAPEDGSGACRQQAAPPRPRTDADAAQALAAAAPLATRWIERLLAQHQPPLTVAR